MPPLQLPANLKFGPFPITATQAFHLSPNRLTYGLVNLKPLLPGHVLVCPVRCVPRLSQLTPRETSDLFLTVQHISRTLERLYEADAFNVAVQDGAEAGQSVPHVHVHVIPRKRSDMDDCGGGDAVYELMDSEIGNVGRAYEEMQIRRKEKEKERDDREFGGPDADRRRVQRSQEEMADEAEWLKTEMDRDETTDHV